MKLFTLALDKSFRPVYFVSAQKAFLLSYQSRCQVIEFYPDITFRTPSTEFKIPAVIRLNVLYKDYYRTPSRLAIFYRDMFICQYCGKVCSDREVTIDHIIPKSRGGDWSWENLVTCCARCNQLKGGRTPEEAGMQLLNQPYKPTSIEVGLKKHFHHFNDWFKEECLPMWLGEKLLTQVNITREK